MRKTTIFIVVALLLTLVGVPVYAADIPPMPHAFYGDVSINVSQAPPGTKVEARGEGVEPGTYNPITTTEWGKYGSADPLGAKLIVQGDIEEDATIYFYVNGEYTGQTYPFDSGEVTSLLLSVTIEAPPPEEVGVAPPAAMYVETDLFGIKKRYLISEEGEIPKIEATSEDGMLTLTIAKGTIALDKDGNPLSTLTVAIDPSPLCPPPENACIIGLAYAFEPAGGTFDPPLTLTWSYDPADLPEDVAEGDLIMAYCDEKTGEWVEIPSTVDLVTHTITGSISHLTTFAIIGAVAPPPPIVPPPPAPAAFSLSHLTVKPVEVEPKEAVTITVSVANTGGMEGSYTVVLKIKGVKEAEKSITIAAGASEIVPFSVTKEEIGSYSVTVDGLSASFTVVAPAPPLVPEEVEEVPKPPINWTLIGGIIAAVVVVALLIFYLVRRRQI